MSNYILYYYLREDFTSPYYVGYGKPRRVHAKHLRRNGADLLPPRERRFVVKSGLSKEEAISLEKAHIALWGRECDGGVLLNMNTGGEGKPGGQKTKGFTGGRHTEDAKRRISEKTRGKNNPRYGVVMSDETKRKISEANKGKYDGANNPNAKTYILTDPDNNQHEVVGRLKSFCKENGLSYGTFHAAVMYGRTGPRRNGWSIHVK